MSLFNRPAWASSAPAKQTEADGNIFSHAGRAYHEIVADQARQRREKREKEEKQKRKAASGRRASATHETDEAARADGGVKRRRITLEDGDDLLISAGFAPTAEGSKGAEMDNGDDLYTDDGPRTTAVTRSPQSGRKSGRKTAQRSPAKNDDSAFAPIAQVAAGGTRAAPIALDGDVEEESDDEFAELTRLARTRQWLKQQKSLPAHEGLPEGMARVDGQGEVLPDPPIHLLITSPIPNTTPLMVRRLFSQRLQEVREAWCTKQNFDAEFAKDIFFIHRMHRLYDVTTCRSLGLEVDVFGNITMKGVEGGEGVDKVHLEAVTDEIFKQMREERARKPLSQQHAAATDGADDRAETQSPKKENYIGLVLKAKGLEELRLKMRPDTRISKIMAAYVKTRAPGHEVIFEFDGERLDPDAEVQNTELDHEDCVDVRIVT